MPRCREPAKMIETNHVHVSKQRTDSVDAPTKARLPQRLPVVDRIAPELSLGAERVGGYASHELWFPIFVQQEQLRVGPDVTRVRRNEKRQITNQAHALSVGITFDPFALAVQQELSKADFIDVARQIMPRAGQGCRHTLDQLNRPFK